MRNRTAAPLLQQRLRAFPAVAVVGPRQCGKTTLARSLGGEYFDLEQESDRVRLDLEWDLLTAGRKLLILDEAQSWPELFPRLRGAIDAARKRHGRFLLLGSVSPALMRELSESLAGRLSVMELTPFLWSELKTEAERGRHWLCGGYPDGGIMTARRYPTWQSDYLALIVQRDLPSWGLPARPQVTTRFLRMLAAVHGQAWNASQMGQSLGISYATVNSYLEFLVGAFLFRRLEPYLPNLKKRLVKAPKLYWRDTGLLHAILGVEDRDDLLHRPWVGASWEGYVVEQVLGLLTSTGRPHEAYYFRTSDGYELDLVLVLGRERIAVEIKLTSAPNQNDVDRLDRVADMVGASRRFLVTRSARRMGSGNTVACDLPTLLSEIAG